jgi:hypothetical protein
MNEVAKEYSYNGWRICLMIRPEGFRYWYLFSGSNR